MWSFWKSFCTGDVWSNLCHHERQVKSTDSGNFPVSKSCPTTYWKGALVPLCLSDLTSLGSNSSLLPYFTAEGPWDRERIRVFFHFLQLGSKKARPLPECHLFWNSAGFPLWPNTASFSFGLRQSTCCPGFHRGGSTASFYFFHPLAETSNFTAENCIAVTQPDVDIGYLNHSIASRSRCDRGAIPFFSQNDFSTLELLPFHKPAK